MLPSAMVRLVCGRRSNQVLPCTRHQRCWVYKTANVLNQVPLSVQRLGQGLRNVPRATIVQLIERIAGVAQKDIIDRRRPGVSSQPPLPRKHRDREQLRLPKARFFEVRRCSLSKSAMRSPRSRWARIQKLRGLVPQ